MSTTAITGWWMGLLAGAAVATAQPVLVTAVDYTLRGDALVKAGKKESAMLSYSRAIELDGKYGPAWHGRGRLRSDLGQYAGAVQDLVTAVELAPNDGAVRVDLGNARLHGGDASTAAKDFARARELLPKNPMPILALSWAECAAGRGDAAASASREFLKQAEPSNGYRPYATLMIYFGELAAGRPTEANKALTEGLAELRGRDWPQPMLAHLADPATVSAEAVLRAAGEDRNLRTEARTYLGLAAVRAGRTSEAREHLEWVARRGNPHFYEHAISAAELARLAQPKP